MRYALCILLLCFCLTVAIGESCAGSLVDTARKIETTWEQAKKDNKDLAKATDKVDEAWKAGKKWVKDQMK
jgi:hypothetical protein